MKLLRVDQAVGSNQDGSECLNRLANTSDEFPKALVEPNADWVYFRFVPSKEQVEAVHRSKKRAFIAGATVSVNQPENCQHAAKVGIDGILTDYPLELRTNLRQNATR